MRRISAPLYHVARTQDFVETIRQVPDGGNYKIYRRSRYIRKFNERGRDIEVISHQERLIRHRNLPKYNRVPVRENARLQSF